MPDRTRGPFFHHYISLLVALALLLVFVLEQWSLPYWAQPVTGTILTRTPSDDPNMNPSVTYKYPLPDGRWATAKGHETQDVRDTFVPGASVRVLRASIWPYWPTLEASTHHDRRQWATLAMVVAGVMVVVVIIRAFDRRIAKRL